MGRDKDSSAFAAPSNLFDPTAVLAVTCQKPAPRHFPLLLSVCSVSSPTAGGQAAGDLESWALRAKRRRSFVGTILCRAAVPWVRVNRVLFRIKLKRKMFTSEGSLSLYGFKLGRCKPGLESGYMVNMLSCTLHTWRLDNISLHGSLIGMCTIFTPTDFRVRHLRPVRGIFQARVILHCASSERYFAFKDLD